jgi:hypothetical protein
MNLRGRNSNFFFNFQASEMDLNKKSMFTKQGKLPLTDRAPAYLLFIFQFLSGNLLAQVQTDSNSIRHESMRQGINTFSFGNGVNFSRQIGSGFQTGIKAGQYAIYNRAIRDNPFITHNVNTGLSLSKTLSKALIWENEAFQQSFIANQTRIAAVISGLSLRIPAGNGTELHIKTLAGFINDKRQQYDNSGFRADLHAGFFRLSPDSGSSWKASFQVSQSNPVPRLNRRLVAEAGTQREFRGGGMLSLEGQYIKNQVEDYLSAEIQSIRSDTALARFKIRIPLFSHLVFQSANEFLTPNRSFFYLRSEGRKEIRNLRYFQDEYQSNSSLLYRNSRFQIQTSFESKLRNRTYDILNRLDPSNPLYFEQLSLYNQQLNNERIKDIRELYNTYNIDSRIQLSTGHSLRTSWTGQLLRVDTRSEQNNQDRDEVLYAGEIAHDWNMAFGFRLTNKISGSYRHLIFIKASQSSENYTDRILRWEPSLRWVNKRISWRSSMGIWATYQVRDFESQQDKNRSNRVLIFQHQLDYRFGKQDGLVAELLRRENRLSQFNWKRFSESPIDTVVLHDLAIRYRFSVRKFALQAGYRAFWQVRKSRASLPEPGMGANLIYLRSWYVQQGPQIKISGESGRFRLQGEIWMQWSSQYFSFKKSTLPYLGNPVDPVRIGQRDDRFLPFFNLQAVWLIGQ